MIKKIITEVISIVLIQINHVFFRKSNILSIYFHNPTEKVFENVLKWLKRNKYEFISTKELNHLIDDKSISSQKLASITFDDGWNDNLGLIDLIEKYKVPVTIFIPTEAVIEGNYWFEFAQIKGQENYTGITSVRNFKKLPGNIFAEKVAALKYKYSLKRSCITLDELLKISQNKFITIGSHSVTHPILITLTAEMQERELLESKETLSKWLNKEVDYLAYPNGDFNENTINIAKKCGYKLGFSTEIGHIDIQNADQFKIPRHAMNDNGGNYENISKILGVWQRFYFKNTLIFKLLNR